MNLVIGNGFIFPYLKSLIEVVLSRSSSYEHDPSVPKIGAWLGPEFVGSASCGDSFFIYNKLTK